MILVVSSPGDIHADEVLEHLIERDEPAELLDLTDFPTQMSLTGRLCANQSQDGCQPDLRLRRPDGWRLELDEVKAIWWRRPQPYQLSPTITDPAMRHFALSEISTAMAGVWQTLDCLWVNDIVRNDAAGHKPWQLATALRAGLTIPETLITNAPEEAREFWQAHSKRVIYKPFLQTRDAWRETRMLREEDEPLLEAVRLAPVMFQELVSGVADIRVTVVGNEIFAAAASLAEASYDLDIRFNPGIHYHPHRLPDDVTACIFGLMEVMGLEFGAIDMRLRDDGCYVFFEVNPAGQFLYVERSSGQPITSELASLLQAGKSTRSEASARPLLTNDHPAAPSESIG